MDAAHIVADSDEAMGHAMVPNGIPLSKIHHAAFDAHLIGIDPDYKLHVSPQLMDQNDGPMLEGLKKLQGVSVHLPRRAKDYRIGTDCRCGLSGFGRHAECLKFDSQAVFTGVAIETGNRDGARHGDTLH